MSQSVPMIAELSLAQRWQVLVAAFLGWMLAGWEISLFVILSRPAMLDVLAKQLSPESAEAVVGQWFAWFQCAFLLGAATGGWLFGWLGDRVGRSRALGASILCYSAVTGVTYFVDDPMLMLVLRFIACLGIGGAWPNAVSLSVEALPGISKALLAGLMGAAANVGFVLFGIICYLEPVTSDSWRWTLLLSAMPAFLGLYVLAWLPESPSWLAMCLPRQGAGVNAANDPGAAQPMREILRAPLLSRTLIGICLGAIPVIGTAANANWLTPWTDQVASESRQSSTSDARAVKAPPDPRLKAWTQITRSSGAIFGSLLGGWLATMFGRRATYFLISLLAFFLSSYIYQYLSPRDSQFQTFAFLLGFVGVTYFGWLPLYLPELFPTRVRSTGTGVTFNSGRVLAAVSVLGAGGLMQAFGGDYARVGTFTGLVYVLGMVVVCFAPDTTRQPAES